MRADQRADAMRLATDVERLSSITGHISNIVGRTAGSNQPMSQYFGWEIEHEMPGEPTQEEEEGELDDAPAEEWR